MNVYMIIEEIGSDSSVPDTYTYRKLTDEEITSFDKVTPPHPIYEHLKTYGRYTVHKPYFNTYFIDMDRGSKFTGTISTQFINCLREIKRDYQLEILLNV